MIETDQKFNEKNECLSNESKENYREEFSKRRKFYREGGFNMVRIFHWGNFLQIVGGGFTGMI